MREITIDLSSDSHLQQPKVFGGYEGEHNETVLKVKLPDRMLGIECSGYRFDFQTKNGDVIRSPLIPVSSLEEGVLSFRLIEQLTIAGKLLFDVAAILADENNVSLISKTNMVALYIDDSPNGASAYFDPNGYKDELLEMIDNRVAEIERGEFLSLNRKGTYLYEVTFNSIPEFDASADFNESNGGCSSYVLDGNLYRNLDWQYNNSATFIVKCNGFEGTAFSNNLTDSQLDVKLIGQLPYHLVDGRNDNGIMVATHVLFNDWDMHGGGSIPLTKLPYIVLTRVKSMETIEDDLDGVLDNLYASPAMEAMEYLIQVIVTDGETTYVLRPDVTSSGFNYEAVDITSNPKLTNFLWVSDETVDRADLQNRPTGVERWNMMPCDLSDLRFTKAYESPTRLSEFIGIHDTTKGSTDEELTEIYNLAHSAYETRTRDGSTWQTMHSVVYSQNGMEHLWVQENWERDYVCGMVDSDYDPTSERAQSGIAVGQAVSDRVPLSMLGSADGVATLNTNGKVPSSQLPSYVDDVVEYDTFDDFPETGESGKIYIAEDTNKTYRWGGSSYVTIGTDLALGETASTAYRGDRGKTAYDHSQTTGNPHGLVAADIVSAERGIELDNNGTFRLPTAFYDYLEEKTYTAPEITSFNVSGLGGTAEIGTSVSVSSINHAESNVAFITGNLTLKKGSVTLKNDIAPSASSSSVSFTEQTVVLNTAGSVTFTLSGTNSKGAAFSRNVSKSFYVPKFTGINANATITASDILQMTRASGLQTTVTVDATKYIYFVTNGTITKITDSDFGFGVPLETAVQTVVEINGVDVTYNVYRTSNRINAGTYHFTIS